MEKEFEVRIISVEHISEMAKEQVSRQVAQMKPEQRKNYMGFVKITYVTASPPRIKDIVPIEGTINDYFNSIGIKGSTAVF